MRDPCSSAQVPLVTVTSNSSRAPRDASLRGRYWAQPAVVQESSEGLTGYRCLSGLKMIHLGHQYNSTLAAICVKQTWYLANSSTISVLPRLCSSVIYQTGSRSCRYGWGAPDRPDSLLLHKGKDNGELSQLVALVQRQ